MPHAAAVLLQAAAAAGSALAERMSSFKLSLLSELEAGLLGTWGSQVKAAAAAEAAQRVEAGLQVRAAVAEARTGCMRPPQTGPPTNDGCGACHDRDLDATHQAPEHGNFNVLRAVRFNQHPGKLRRGKHEEAVCRNTPSHQHMCR